jgi:hypothetical protein
MWQGGRLWHPHKQQDQWMEYQWVLILGLGEVEAGSQEAARKMRTLQLKSKFLPYRRHCRRRGAGMQLWSESCNLLRARWSA